MDISKEGRLINLFDRLFKIVFIGFWTVFLFTTTISTNDYVSVIIFQIYNTLLLAYIIFYLFFSFMFKLNSEKIIVYYRISTLLAFLSTSYSFVMFPTSITLFVIKLIFIFIYIYISSIKVYKYKIEEGVVGIMSSTLIIVMLLCYS